MVDLTAVRKKAPGSFDRAVSAAEVSQRIPELRKRFGITRVGELTYLDRIGIPVMTAIVPRSRDALGVYNGKGRTKRDALVGAVMEAGERQAAAAYAQIHDCVKADNIRKALDIDALGLFALRGKEALPCTIGFDLLNETWIPVPVALVRTPWDGAPTFPSSHTNGLASGMTLFDAIHHALLEVVERHVWSITHLRAHVLPRLLADGYGGDVDEAIAYDIELPTGIGSVDELVGRIHEAGLRVRLLALQERHLPLTVHASIIDPGEPVVAHALGIGTSWSPQYAAIRAITEAAQSRLVEIQAAREDIRRRKIRRNGRWYYNGPARHANFADYVDAACDDLTVEVVNLVHALRLAGAKTIAVVDVSPRDWDVSVVRVIVPELETYFVDGRAGPIARATINEVFARLSSRM